MEKNKRDPFNSRGAEAKVYFSDLFGKKVVVKVRDKKRYRIQQLDEFLRKTRNKTEGRCILHALKNKVNVPKIYHIGRYNLILQRLNGKLMKEKSLKKKDYFEVGKLLANLHSIGITHGDFTPANVMFVDSVPYIIDFGLAEFSNDPEEKAIDVLLMKRSIGKSFKYFLEGYKKLQDWKKIIKQMEEIEKRGRYRRREQKKKETEKEIEEIE